MVVLAFELDIGLRLRPSPCWHVFMWENISILSGDTLIVLRISSHAWIQLQLGLRSELFVSWLIFSLWYLIK